MYPPSAWYETAFYAEAVTQEAIPPTQRVKRACRFHMSLRAVNDTLPVHTVDVLQRPLGVISLGPEHVPAISMV